MQTKAWHTIPTEVLRAARKQRGWSYETCAGKLGMSSKTWERYEKAGRVPKDIVGTVIAVLGLDIETPAYAKLHLILADPDGTPPPTAAEVMVIIRQTRETLELLTEALRVLSDRFPGAPASPQSSEVVEQPQ